LDRDQDRDREIQWDEKRWIRIGIWAFVPKPPFGFSGLGYGYVMGPIYIGEKNKITTRCVLMVELGSCPYVATGQLNFCTKNIRIAR
jgi:hypothetical protein